MSEKEILREFSTIKGALMWRCPFLGSLLTATRAVVLPDLPGAYAAVDDSRTIYINAKKWEFLDRDEKVAVIAHEVLHLAFRHAARVEGGGYDRDIYNIAADAAINWILENEEFELPSGSIRMSRIAEVTKLPEDQLKKLTAEGIYKLIKDKVVKIPGVGVPSDGEGEGGGGDDVIVIQESEIPGFGKDLRPDLGKGRGEEGEGKGEGKEAGEGEEIDWDKYWREAVSRAAVIAKQAGKLPGGIERIFKILRPKVHWRLLLREALVQGFRKVLSTYRRLSRKYPALPGHQRYGIGRGWVMIDCSGSISEDELNQFASEIYEISKKYASELKVVPWDVEVYEVSTVRSPGDITKVKLKGGGGTCIFEAAKFVAERMRPRDFVVILSDGFIFDIEKPEVQGLLSRISSKASAAVFVSNAADVRLPPRWTLIKIQ